MDFSTTDRFAADPHDPAKLVRAPLDDADGRMARRGRRPSPLEVGSGVAAPEGEFAYVDFTQIAGNLAFDVNPGE